MKTSLVLIILAIIVSRGCKISPEKESKGIHDTDTMVINGIFPFQSGHCHGSTIVELPNMDLLVAWFQGSGERTAEDVKIMGSRRNHSTGKWSEPFIMADVPGFPDINPVLFIDSEKTLWLAWYTVMAYQWESSILKYRKSTNYLQTEGPPEWDWQDMIHVRPDGNTPDGIAKNDPFVVKLMEKYEKYRSYLDSMGYLGEGKITEELWESSLKRYIDRAKGTNFMATGVDIDEKGERIRTMVGYPLMRRIGWQTRNKPLITGKRIVLPLYSDGFDFSMMAITEDAGATWSFSEPVVGAGNIQPALPMTSDGVITAFMRDNGPAPHRLMKSTSKDGGETWSTVEDTDIPNPGSAADIAVLKSGNWVLVCNDLDAGRHRLSVWLSQDEGETWPYRKSIANGEPGSQVRAHYPAVIQDNEGLIHVSFTNQVPGDKPGSSVKNIAHAVISETWLLKHAAILPRE